MSGEADFTVKAEAEGLASIADTPAKLFLADSGCPAGSE